MQYLQGVTLIIVSVLSILPQSNDDWIAYRGKQKVITQRHYSSGKLNCDNKIHLSSKIETGLQKLQRSRKSNGLTKNNHSGLEQRRHKNFHRCNRKHNRLATKHRRSYKQRGRKKVRARKWTCKNALQYLQTPRTSEIAPLQHITASTSKKTAQHQNFTIANVTKKLRMKGLLQLQNKSREEDIDPEVESKFCRNPNHRRWAARVPALWIATVCTPL